MMTQLLIKNISLPLGTPEEEAIAHARKKLHAVLPNDWIVGGSIYKRSVDARRRTQIQLVYSVLLSVRALPQKRVLEKLERMGITLLKDGTFPIERGDTVLSARPVVIGFGPGGMFAALLLAEQGYRPIVLERGADVEARAEQVTRFLQTGVLNAETNIQFGAGGAGTFSDGKLVTRINDHRLRYVLEVFAAMGAPEQILTLAKPHIGTDRLREVVANIRDRIRLLGGEIRFGVCVKDFIRDRAGNITHVCTEQGDLACGAVILAIGHSARDTYAMLGRRGVILAPKPFSVGVRIEHLQEDVDRALYGEFAKHPDLGKGEYAFSRRVGEEAVYTFCMCPGGEVIAAASEEGGVVTNGMSRFARDGRNANAALVVSVSPENGIDFQRNLEQKAFCMGGGEFVAPMQTVGDYLSGRVGSEPGRVLPTYRNGKTRLCDLSLLFPERINEMLRLGLTDFERKLPGFAAPDALLTGVETRTSAPLRILREEDTLHAIGCGNLYPCGEGAGYAGGISSAAVDGIACACALMKQFCPKEAEAE